MILFIWVSIHKPQVDKDIVVNNNFIFKGSLTRIRLFKEDVISNILKIAVLM